jgi:CO/xanthine dehydrogenase Mo-binding subunit
MAKDERNTEFRLIGTRPNRPDGLDKVTGRARYGADMTLPGMLFAAVVRSPHAVLTIGHSPTMPATG